MNRPTDAEFEELKRKRDEAVKKVVEELWAQHFKDTPREEMHFHASGGGNEVCYCACPDGPCQHIWDGPDKPFGLEEGEPEEQAHGWSKTCSRCGTFAINHDMRFMP